MATIRKLELMHKMFSRCDGHTCSECSNLISYKYHDRTYRKCTVYGDTRSEASDWASRWLACGMFNKQYTGKPVIKLVRPQNRVPELSTPLDGQMMMEVLIMIEKYISVSNTEKQIDKDVYSTESERAYMKNLIRKTPADDVAKVVRCKDCKFRYSSEFCECRPEYAFCSDGERKDGVADG